MKPITVLAALAPLMLGACATMFGPGSPFAVDRKGDLVEFTYAWSAEASRQPLLVRRLRADLERAFAASAAVAEADRGRAKIEGRPFNAHRYSRRWETAGQSSRLLSLDGRLTFSTGATRVDRADALLWDRATRSPIRAEQLFITRSLAEQFAVRPGCVDERRSASAPGACPSGLVLPLPADRDKNRRFDHFRVVHPGPRPVLITTPVTVQMLAAIKPAYRPGFEVAQSPQ